MSPGALGDLDPVIHAPKRLAAVAVLFSSDQVSFQFLKEHLGVADADLSKQMSALEAAGYVKVHKTGRGRGSSTTYALTRDGRAAYRRHRAALRALLGEDGTAPGAD
ncbi:transcriptional regulator [Nocardioides sp. ChNu-153]|uniref:transcriptional regulator n=1 Tax=unclassified Nocardioides TaxID=2615069 RepID=UPI0024054C23|nr:MULTISPECIES: transcriptional regulator [unclassified Nocardioides]MDF9715517.1 transcriptional regulator [Nocardioides sp. ChNu-99]MDN7120728.1 transcriptional regulator [Nocardioides sp. ChNu-153]